MIIDIHCHYARSAAPPVSAPRFSFEHNESPADSQAPKPTDYDTCLSPRALDRRSTWLLRQYAGWPEPGPVLDRALDDFFDRHLLYTKLVDRCLLLAFDAYFRDDGTCAPLPQDNREVGSDLYTSNSIVRALCREHPKQYLFGASIHPYRPNAIEALEEVFAAGASLLKLMPLHQNIDITDPRSEAFFLKCRELGLPLLLHYGPELALKTEHQQYGQIATLLTLLNNLRRVDAMPPVIVAHIASPALPTGPWRHYRLLVEALRNEFRQAPLYADISAILSPGKVVAMLSRTAADVDLHHKLLFGTDFPVVPALPWLRLWYGQQIDWSAAWPDVSLEVCRSAGFSSVVFEQAAELLPNVK